MHNIILFINNEFINQYAIFVREWDKITHDEALV